MIGMVEKRISFTWVCIFFPGASSKTDGYWASRPSKLPDCHLLLCYNPAPFGLHRASQKLSVNSMTKQNH